jgi:hypothetical protein
MVADIEEAGTWEVDTRVVAVDMWVVAMLAAVAPQQHILDKDVENTRVLAVQAQIAPPLVSLAW